MSIRIVLVNAEDSGVTDAQLETVAAAIEVQIAIELAHMWKCHDEITERVRGLQVRAAHRVEPLLSDWRCELVEQLPLPADQRRVKGGFHRVRANVPYALVATVWPEGTPMAGTRHTLDRVSIMISHECIEMIANPFNTDAVQTRAGVLAFELADPVQHQAYRIHNVAVSNWITPRWFQPHIILPLFDRLGHCKGPHEVRPGGFIGKCIDGAWYLDAWPPEGRRLILESKLPSRRVHKGAFGGIVVVG